MEPEMYQSSACDASIVKQEPVEADTFTSPVQEIEFISVKQEPPVEADTFTSPMQEIEFISIKQEPPVEADQFTSPVQETEYIPVKEETPCVQEWAVADGQFGTLDPLNIVKVESEECSASGFPVPTTFNIEKTEDEEEQEKAVTEDNLEKLEHEAPSTSSSSDPGSATPTGVKDDKGDDGSSGVVTNVSMAAGTGNGIQCTTKQEASSGENTDNWHLIYSATTTGMKDNKGDNGSNGVVTNVSMAAGTGNGIQCSTEQEASSAENTDNWHLIHRCVICKKTFTQPQDINEHTHVNSCELLYSCSVCDKTFEWLSEVRRHFRVHTGERPYRCDHCNKTFTHITSMKQHALLHTGEQPYSCDVCHMRFSIKSYLKRHSRVHAEPYSCNICQKKFKCKRSFNRHITSFH